MRAVARFLLGQAVVAVVTVSLPWLVLAVFPGVLKATAPVLCPEGQPDGEIVEYNTDTGDGRGTSWTLVCLGPDGDLTEVGTWKPLALFFAAVVLALEAMVLPLHLAAVVRRRRRRRKTGPSPWPPGPPPPPRSPRRVHLGVRVGG